MGRSHRRAESIRTALIADGVPSSRIDMQWVGTHDPAVPEATGVREPLNRVVENVVH